MGAVKWEISCTHDRAPEEYKKDRGDKIKISKHTTLYIHIFYCLRMSKTLMLQSPFRKDNTGSNITLATVKW